MKRKLLHIILVILLLLPLFSFTVEKASAAENCSILNRPTVTTADKVIDGIRFQVTNGFDFSGNTDYFVYVDAVGGFANPRRINATVNLNSNNRTISINESFDKNGNTQGSHDENFEMGPVYFYIMNGDKGEGIQGGLARAAELSQCNTNANMTLQVQTEETECRISFLPIGELKPSTNIFMKVEFINPALDDPNNPMEIHISGNGINPTVQRISVQELKSAGGASIGTFGSGQYLVVAQRELGAFNVKKCSANLTINPEGGGQGCTDDSCAEDQVCLPADDSGVRICATKEKYDVGETSFACNENPAGSGIFVCNTALGEISTDPESFAQSVLRLFLGIAGGILLLLIIINGYKLMVSQGDPEKIKEGRDGIIAAIAGILLIIFSLALLQLITADILGIPGFG